MKEYNIQIKVRNNFLLAKMRSFGYETAADLSRAAGVSQSIIGDYLNLTDIPTRKRDGEFKAAVAKLCEHFRCSPRDIFPENHIHSSLEKNRAEVEVSFAEIGGMLSYDMQGIENKIDDNSVVSRLLLGSDLSEREKQVLEHTFFEGRTLEAASEKFDISRERVRQIQQKALRKMRRVAGKNQELQDRFESA